MAGELLLINPRKRKARKARTKTARKARKARRSTSITVRSNPIKRRKVRRFRRNPIGLSGGGIVKQVMSGVQDGAIGAGGAIATKALLSFIPLPAALKSGVAAPLVTAVAGVLVGTLAGNVIGKANGAKMAQGAITVALYQLAASQLAGKVPGLSGDETLLGEYDSAMGEYDSGMGANDGLLGEDDSTVDLGYAGAGVVDEFSY